MDFKKILGLVNSVVSIALIISFFIKEHEYYNTYNIWVEEEDKGNKLPITLAVIAVVTVLAILVFLPTIKKIKGITKGKTVIEGEFSNLRKRSISQICSSALGTLFLTVVTEEVVAEFFIEQRVMDILEIAYTVGQYQIFRTHFLIMAIVNLICEIVTFPYFEVENKSAAFTCSGCGNPTTEKMLFCPYCGNSIQKDNNSSNNVLTREEQKEIINIRRKSYLLLLAILLGMLFLMIVILLVKFQPSIDIEDFVANIKML